MPTAVATAVLIVAILFFFVFCVGNRHGAVYLSFFDFPEFGPLIVCFSFFAPTVFLAVAILIFAFIPLLAIIVVAMLAAIDLP